MPSSERTLTTSYKNKFQRDRKPEGLMADVHSTPSRCYVSDLSLILIFVFRARANSDEAGEKKSQPGKCHLAKKGYKPCVSTILRFRINNSE